MKKYQKIWQQPASKARSLIKLAKDYLAGLLERNYSKSTYYSRRSYLGFFLTWCNDRAITTVDEVSDITLQHYQQYLLRYRSEQYGGLLSTNARRRKLETIRLFFRWLVRNDHLLYSPASDLEIPKAPKHLPRHVLTREEAETIINHPDTGTPLGLRNRAMLETLYSTGIRASELLHLTIDDVDFERETIVVREGKGQKDRIVPIGKRALQWIKKYIQQGRKSRKKTTRLYLTQYGQPFRSMGSLNDAIKQAIKGAGITKSCSCHTFRHTMSTLMLENGASVRHIQEILGHSNIETTQRYTRVAINKLRQVHALTHPAEISWQQEFEDF